MDDNCGEWVECMGVASGCGEQEVGVASGSGWNLWVWLLGVVLRRYIDFLILLIPTPLVSVLFGSSIPTSFFILLKSYIYCNVCTHSMYHIYIYFLLILLPLLPRVRLTCPLVSPLNLSDSAALFQLPIPLNQLNSMY